MDRTPEERLRDLGQTAFVYTAKKRAMGCLMGLVVVFLGTVLITVLFTPWAYYMGGHFTPMGSWEGVGTIRSSTGAQYGLYLKLSHYRSRRQDRNLDGFAALCNPTGGVLKYHVYGWLDDAWLFTEGKHTKLDLWKVKGEPVDTHFSLEGQWQNGALVMRDQGSMGIPFRADGSVHPKGAANLSPIKGELAQVTVNRASQMDFDELCANSIAIH